MGTFSGKKINKIDVGTVFCYHKSVISNRLDLQIIIDLFFDIRRNESQLHCVCGDSQGLSAFVL